MGNAKAKPPNTAFGDVRQCIAPKAKDTGNRFKALL